MNTKTRRTIIFIIVSILIILLGVFVVSRNRAPAQTGNTNSSGSLVLTDAQGEYPLGLHMAILEDPGGELTIEDVSSPAFDSKFAPSTVEVPVYGYTDSAYWVRLSLDNQTLQVTQWLLEVDFPNTQYVDLFTPLPDGAGFSVKQTGVLRPLDTRDLLYPNIVFDLNLPTKSQQTYYLRFESGASMDLGLTLWTMDTFWRESSQVFMVHWLFFGGLLVLLAYHLLLLYSLREITYLYFVLLLASLIATFSAADGYLGVYYFPNLNYAKLVYMPLTIIFMAVSILLFTDEFMEARTRFPKLHSAIIGFIVIWGVLALLVPFLSYGDLAPPVVIWLMLSLVLTMITGITAWVKGFQLARFFMLAWFIWAVTFFLFLLVRLGIIPSTNFTENAYRFGMIFMAVCWSVSLADRISLLKTETEVANRNLRNNEHQLSQILDGMPLGVVVYGKDRKPKFASQRTFDILSNPAQGIRPDIKSGRTLEQAVEYFSFRVAETGEKYPVEKVPVYRALQGEPATVDDIEANLGDRHVPLELWASPIKDESGNVESAVVVFEDITQRKQVESELLEHRNHLAELVEKRTAELERVNKRLQLRLDWLSEINSVHQTIASDTSLSKVFEELSARILLMLEARLVFVLSWEIQREHSEVSHSTLKGDVVPETEAITALFQPGSPLRREIELGKTISSTTDRVISISEAIGEYFQEQDIQFLVFAPMSIGQVNIGVLGVAVSGDSQDFIIQQVDMVEQMAFDLASLAQDAILLDQAFTLAVLEERNRLARDLHDSVTQVLFSATLLADVLPQIWRRNPEEGLQKLDNLRQLSRGALAEMRTLLLELRPSSVINTPLADLLTQLAEAVTSRSGLSFNLFIEQVPSLPEKVQIAFYRIAQEALNNIVKHARAKQITMNLSITPLVTVSANVEKNELKLEILDDGVGYTKGIKQPGHLGIGIMNERASAIQAKLLMESQPGCGTRITLLWCGELVDIND